MLRDREGRKLWIQTERGEFDPLESYQQIDERRKSQSGPDWWVVAKEPDWAPPKRRMSLVAGGLGGHTKPNSHGDQQPYDELGRYAGPGEGAWSEKPEGEKTRGGSLLSAFLKTSEGGEAGGDILLDGGEFRAEAHWLDENPHSAKAQSGNLPNAGQAPMRATPEPQEADEKSSENAAPQRKPKIYIYEQSTGKFFDSAGNLLATEYSGAGKGKNNPDMQHVPNIGPTPRGDWEVVGVDQKRKGHRLILRPLPGNTVFETERRPKTFQVHGDFLDPVKRGTASQGCIILPSLVRHQLQPGDIIRVVR
ncbi:hypothetical protein [Desulfovibrio aminophilus]|uniref:tlde1 domain-containing protein n=1 Tax=Desulfovibrio aminophilus TaxID=81425 RepID=UPI00339A300E